MRAQRKINNFYVFYRISDNGNKNKAKLGFATKKNCLKNALNVFDRANVIIFVDGVTEKTDKDIHELSDGLSNVTVKYINAGGDTKSFRVLYENAIILNDNDFVYFLEDDYFHLNGSFESLKDFAEMNYTDYVTLYDHPDKYDYGCSVINPYCKDFGEKTTIFRTKTHHWKITNSTTMTFGAFVNTLKRDKDIFWDGTDPSVRVTKDFQIFLNLRKNNAFLSSPIPTLSTHGEIKYLAPFIDWEEAVKL